LLKGALTQSGVPDDFLMAVPFYVDFDGPPVWLGTLAVSGSGRGKEFQVTLPRKPKRVLLNAFQDILAYEATAVQAE
jgi:hypothetical protein